MRIFTLSQIAFFVLLTVGVAFTPWQSAHAEGTEYDLACDIYSLIEADLKSYAPLREKVISKWRDRADEIEKLSDGMPAMYRAVAGGLVANLCYPVEYEDFRKTYSEMMNYWAVVDSKKESSLSDKMGRPIVGFFLDRVFHTEFDLFWADTVAKSKGNPNDFITINAKSELRFFLPNTAVAEAVLREVLVTPYLIGELQPIVHERAAPYGAYTVASCNTLWPLNEISNNKKTKKATRLFLEVYFAPSNPNNLYLFNRFAVLTRTWSHYEFYPFFADSSGVKIPQVRMGAMDQIERTELPFDESNGKQIFEEWVAANPQKAGEYRMLVAQIREQGIPTPQKLYPNTVVTPTPLPSSPPARLSNAPHSPRPTADAQEQTLEGDTMLYVIVGLILAVAVAVIVATVVKRKWKQKD